MLYFHGIGISEEASPLPTSSTRLAYLRDGVSTPSVGGERTGKVFDEMDLGLEFEDMGGSLPTLAREVVLIIRPI